MTIVRDRPRPVAPTWWAELFPAAARQPVTARNVGLGVLAVIAGAALSLGRIGGPGPFDSIWAEDAQDFLTDALTKPGAQAVFTPLNGYFVIGPRLLAEVASAFPVAWAPAVLSTEAALVTALVALGVYVASGGYLRHPLSRLLLSVPVVVAPVAENHFATCTNNLATGQFVALYGLFWLLLWVPGSRAGTVTAVTAVGLIAVSTLLAAVFLPLALVRLWARRDRGALVMSGLMVLGAALHLAALALGLTVRPPATATPIPAVASGYAGWAVPHEILGYRWLDPPPVTSGIAASPIHHWYQPVAVLVAWLIAALALGSALSRVTRPLWTVAVPAAFLSAVLLVVEIASSGVQERYAIAPGLLLVAALVAVLQPGAGRTGLTPLTCNGLVLAVVLCVNYRGDSWRTLGPSWRDRLAVAVTRCRTHPAQSRVDVPTSPGALGWRVEVPCVRLR